MYEGTLGDVPTLEVWRCFKAKEAELRMVLNSLYKSDLTRTREYSHLYESRWFLAHCKLKIIVDPDIVKDF